jgi:hypothetical protein
MSAFSSAQYLLEDLPRTLFPMGTTRCLVESGADELFEFVYKKALNQQDDTAFVPQARCFAAKSDFHLRRTLKLDPCAELFIYDLVYRNRQTFRQDHRTNRISFGYRFSEGRPISPMTSYREFRKTGRDAERTYKYSLQLDVALYFNSVYHHDLVSYFSDNGWPSEDVAHLGQFLRQINAGRSIDCLPQGLNPCKAIGAEFLRFIDNSARLRSPLLLRFLDDIALYSDDESDLIADLLVIQELLGEKGLSLNAAKTKRQAGVAPSVEDDVDEMKVSLLQIRQELIEVSGEPREVEVEEYRPLSDGQTEYLLALLRAEDLDEADAELILTLLTEHGDEVLLQLGSILSRFPVLAKTLFSFLSKSNSREGLGDIVLSFVKNQKLVATEYQLFWLAAIAETFLSADRTYGDVLMALFEHRFATLLSQARVLEIPENRFGMPELRAGYLRSGQSNWLAWAAAAGCRKQTPQGRNHLLSYFANASSINGVMATILMK